MAIAMAAPAAHAAHAGFAHLAEGDFLFAWRLSRTLAENKK
jgi:hypothetical protein